MFFSRKSARRNRCSRNESNSYHMDPKPDFYPPLSIPIDLPDRPRGIKDKTDERRKKGEQKERTRDAKMNMGKSGEPIDTILKTRDSFEPFAPG